MIDLPARAPSRLAARSTSWKILVTGGIGDALLTTPALRALKRQYPQTSLDVLCAAQPHADIFRHNPNIDRLSVLSRDQLKLFTAPHGPSPPDYKRVHYAVLAPMLQRKHATELIAEMLDVSLIERQLEIFLTSDEEAIARRIVASYPQTVAIHTTSFASANQNWSIASWEALVRRNPEYTFLQLGGSGEVPIGGCVDLRGKLAIRESIAVLRIVRAFVGVVSSMAHATNAVGTPAVVLFGASAPEVWSHPNQRVLTRQLSCAPCIDLLRDVPCPYSAPCMSEITVEEVEAALYEVTASRVD